MAVVRIPDEERVLTEVGAIRAHLASLGIWYEKWSDEGRCGADASAAEILAAYAPEIQELNARGGYITADVIDVTPDVPGLQAMLDRFNKEHTHAEDEVRFIVKGNGVFHIHPEDGPVFAIEVREGDLINIPAGIRHWFDLCADRCIRAIRLFREKAGWTPEYTGSTVAEGYQPMCLGPDYLGSSSFSDGASGPSGMIHFHGGLILLDVEGTVSPLAFVHEVMFPFARRNVAAFLKENVEEGLVIAALEQVAIDGGHASLAEWCPFALPSSQGFAWLEAQVRQWMDADAKLTGLKRLQGLIWEKGFKNGELCAVLFDEVAQVLRDWHASGLQIRIYSSGSVHAQKMFFSHTSSGDLTPFLRGYYDTTTGPKRDVASYQAIAADAGFAPREVLFLSDVTAELDAAHCAGMQTGLAIRPGNHETKGVQHLLFRSLHDITIVRP